MKSIYIIANGKSAQDKRFRDLVAEYREKNWKIDVRVTWEQGDAERFVAEAIAANASQVVAAGGDGTINGVLAGLMVVNEAQRPIMGIIPMGTANDFARFCGLPCDNLGDCFELLYQGENRWFDVGQANNIFFINMASGGFSSEITTETPDELKNIIGKAAYFFTGLTQFRNLNPITVEIVAGDFKYSGDILCFSIGLGIQAGGGVQLFSEERKEGFFNILIVPGLEQANKLKLLHELLSKTSSELSEEVFRLQTNKISIKSKNSLQVNLDGEPFKSENFEFKVIPNAVQIIAPQKTR